MGEKLVANDNVDPQERKEKRNDGNRKKIFQEAMKPCVPKKNPHGEDVDRNRDKDQGCPYKKIGYPKSLKLFQGQ